MGNYNFKFNLGLDVCKNLKSLFVIYFFIKLLKNIFYKIKKKFCKELEMCF